MKTTLTLAFLTLLLGSLSYAQNMEKYDEFIAQADSLFAAKAYQSSADKFKAAFDELDGKARPFDRYNAACAYALADDNENAFYHLFYLAEHPQVRYNDLSHIKQDPDLAGLHANKQWAKLIGIVQANKEEYEKDLDKPLVAKLDSIYQLDQNYRREVDEIEEKYGRDSEEMRAQWKLIQRTDSVNLIEIKKILDERGWLGPEVIGAQGNSTLFLVIQHSDLETQLTYLPMMKEAVQQGNAAPSSLALLEDRVALRQGKRQIYGSQIGQDPATGEFYVLPLIEPEKVNERRAEVGLPPIEEYVRNWDLTWDVEKHKERTKQAAAEKQD
ncbi:MAG: DUF6624 domain-containing protein [Bacteroidota bacterium]